jgi:hypothetical protein
MTTPRAPWWLRLLLAALSLANALGMAGAISVSATTLALFNGLWTVVFGALAALTFRLPAPRLARTAAVAVIVYACLRLLTLIVLAHADYERGRIAFQLVLTVLIVVAAWWWARRTLRSAV